jgi:hypothetical protein
LIGCFLIQSNLTICELTRRVTASTASSSRFSEGLRVCGHPALVFWVHG